MGLQCPDHPEWYTFSKNGSLYSPSANSGLDASCLALKICYMLDILERFPEPARLKWISYIQSFQSQRRFTKFFSICGSSGLFEDQRFIRCADKQFSWPRKDIKTRRAVTRQACAALLCAGAGPLYPVNAIPLTTEKVLSYLSSFDWENDPWGAGSHVSHLVFFLKLNRDMFGYKDSFQRLLPIVFTFLDEIRNPETGSWYQGEPPVSQIINSAMKVLTAYAVLNRPLDHPEALIDFTLSAINNEDGCHNLDILYVLHYCQKFTNYRVKDIEDFCLKRIDVIKQFRKNDGAFSFYRDHSQTSIYNVQITRGLCESDIHGTVLFVWALTMIADILNCTDEFSWKTPIN